MTWPASKNRAGVTFVTVAGVRYQIEGTGHSYSKLVRLVKNGLAAIVDKGDGGKGEK